MIRTTFGRVADAGCAAAGAATAIATRRLSPIRMAFLFEDGSQRVHLRGIDFTDLHRRHRYVAVRHRPHVRALRTGAAFFELVPVDRSAGGMLRLDEVFLATLLHGLRRDHVARVAVGWLVR